MVSGTSSELGFSSPDVAEHPKTTKSEHTRALPHPFTGSISALVKKWVFSFINMT
jgi:hypothetical protein